LAAAVAERAHTGGAVHGEGVSATRHDLSAELIARGNLAAAVLELELAQLHLARVVHLPLLHQKLGLGEIPIVGPPGVELLVTDVLVASVTEYATQLLLGAHLLSHTALRRSHRGVRRKPTRVLHRLPRSEGFVTRSCTSRQGLLLSHAAIHRCVRLHPSEARTLPTALRLELPDEVLLPGAELLSPSRALVLPELETVAALGTLDLHEQVLAPLVVATDGAS
jgi:hypothetical protein